MQHRSWSPSSRAFALALALPLLAAAAAPARAADVPTHSERLQVAEPYLDMRTGPGRGYPVFFVVEKAQSVTVELRLTDWYRVRAEGGQVGWVPRKQLEATLTASGAEVVGNSPREMGRFFLAEKERWAKLIRDTGFKLQQ